jgi:glycosyltransferase involved in cell wall biosynthesis
MPGQAEMLAKCLRREGWEVVEIRTNLHGGKIVSALDSTRFVRTLLRLPVFLVRLALALPRVRILHIMSCSGLYFFLFTIPPVLLGIFQGRKIILHYHSGGAEAFFSKWPRSTQWVMARAHAILVPSEFLRRVFEKRCLNAVVVGNIIDLDSFKPPKVSSVCPNFVVARHLEPHYNIECVIRAFELVKKTYGDAVLTIVGGGSEERRLKAFVTELGLSNSIRFLGYVDNGKMPQIYRKASIFLNGSNVDNLPVSILEAFAAGLPVVTTGAGGIPDLVEDGRTGLIVGLNDYEAMAQKILRLLENSRLAQTLVANAREELKAYSWPEVFKKLRNVYTLMES